MKNLTFYILDVFTSEKYSGNQLAVVTNARMLSADVMQNIAKEMNFSETTFITSGKLIANGYNVRIFTPMQEVPFAGHPSLGTAFIIQHEIIQKPIKKVKLNLKAGQVPVSFKYNNKDMPIILWMKQNEPEFIDVIDPERIAPVLNIDKEDIDERFPVQEVSTGLPFIIVPIKKLSAVKKAKIDASGYYELIQTTTAKAIFIFCPETYGKENDFNARMFADCFGIPEDPATGSANGCLAGYLIKHRHSGSEKINVRVEQGYEIGRPSILHVRAEEKDGSIDVHVGGSVVLVAKGELV
jgi:trans-2,3-dihydro-3-hydroxyanthranilate isomerase